MWHLDQAVSPPFIPGEYCVRIATAPWERAGYYAVRREVFCDEQGIFVASDLDPTDEVSTPIVAMSCILGSAESVVGGVRIHRSAPGLWHGSRLAVHHHHRRGGGIGAELIRMAVSTANARGCEHFLAHVQSQNVSLFERMHWRSLREMELCGRPHHEMEADLSFYPPDECREKRLLRPLAAHRATLPIAA